MDSLKRFISRMALHENQKFIIKSIKELQPPVNFIKHAQNKPILELYHKTRETDDNGKWNFKNIETHGFMISRYGNKGPGVYMANHGRYSYSWGGLDISGYNNVIICKVIYDPAYVFRYRSELNSPNFNSEYKITNTELIYPQYFIEYDVPGKRIASGWVEHGKFGCKKCDINKIRCDCVLNGYDSFDEMAPI